MADTKNSREKLVEKARTEYGLVNADDMSDAQLKQEMKALDEQKNSNDQPVENTDTRNTTKNQTTQAR